MKSENGKHFTEDLKGSCLFLSNDFVQMVEGDMVKCELRVANTSCQLLIFCELRVTSCTYCASYELRVALIMRVAS